MHFYSIASEWNLKLLCFWDWQLKKTDITAFDTVIIWQLFGLVGEWKEEMLAE